MPHLILTAVGNFCIDENEDSLGLKLVLLRKGTKVCQHCSIKPSMWKEWQLGDFNLSPATFDFIHAENQADSSDQLLCSDAAAFCQWDIWVSQSCHRDACRRSSFVREENDCNRNSRSVPGLPLSFAQTYKTGGKIRSACHITEAMFVHRTGECTKHVSSLLCNS